WGGSAFESGYGRWWGFGGSEGGGGVVVVQGFGGREGGCREATTKATNNE
nr:hypothetical protein [Tanacetum cinerariifolium]